MQVPIVAALAGAVGLRFGAAKQTAEIRKLDRELKEIGVVPVDHLAGVIRGAAVAEQDEPGAGHASRTEDGIAASHLVVAVDEERRRPAAPESIAGVFVRVGKAGPESVSLEKRAEQPRDQGVVREHKNQRIIHGVRIPSGEMGPATASSEPFALDDIDSRINICGQQLSLTRCATWPAQPFYSRDAE